MGLSEMGAPYTRGAGKICDFRQITPFVSKTIQDRRVYNVGRCVEGLIRLWVVSRLILGVSVCLSVVLQEEMAMAAASRRMSVAPVNRAASNIRNMSGRHGSMFYGRSTFVEGNLLKVMHWQM